MESKTWATSADGGILYKQITKTYLQDVLNLVSSQFLPYENVTTVLGVATDPQTISELVKITEMVAYDGVSVVAIDKSTDRVVGAILNTIHFLGSTEPSTFETFVKNCTDTKAKDMIQFLIDFDSNCNVFELCQTDCLMELTQLIVHPDYRNRGIGTQLFKTSLEIGALLKSGINVKLPINDVSLSLEPVPKAACTTLTSLYSQKIVHTLQFEIPFRKNIDEFEYNGKNFKASIGKKLDYIELAYKIL